MLLVVTRNGWAEISRWKVPHDYPSERINVWFRSLKL